MWIQGARGGMGQGAVLPTLVQRAREQFSAPYLLIETAAPKHCPSGAECRFNSCHAPQETEGGEAADQGAAPALPARASGWHVAYSQRPLLQACTEDDFEADLMAFLEGRGQHGLARLIRDNRVTW